MATKTFTGEGDGFSFDDPLNWDAGIPGMGDDAVIDGSVSGIVDGVLACDSATFSNSVINYGTVNANCSFSSLSENQGAVVGDTITFTDSYNYGIVNGNVTFNGTSENHGTVDGANTPGLCAYWKFNETSGDFADATGNGKTGIPTDVTYSASGKLSRCAQFVRASESHIFVDGSGVLNIAGDLSISLWIKTSSTDYAFILQKYTSGNDGFALAIGTFTPGKLAFFVSGSAGWKESGTTINDGEWHHIGIVLSGTTLKLYTDAVAETFTLVAPLFGNNTTLRIGNYISNGYAFDGSVDELGVWNNVLSAGDVESLYGSNDGLAYDAGNSIFAGSSPSSFSCTFSGNSINGSNATVSIPVTFTGNSTNRAGATVTGAMTFASLPALEQSYESELGKTVTTNISTGGGDILGAGLL